MSSYSSFERKIARILRSNQTLKAILKNIYISIMRLGSLNVKRSETDKKYESVHSSEESFFGYYDKNPSNGKGLVIFHTSEFNSSKSPKLSKYIKINLQEENSKKIIWSKKTKAFNWQQGSRLQWVTDDKFIYNDFDKNRNIYISKLVSSKDFKVTIFDLPVQDAYYENYFLSLNYRRLETLRSDYGYHCMPKLTKLELKDYSSDGIWKMDISSQCKNLLYSLSEIIKFEFKEEFPNATHKVNHIQISPDGERFIFLHRYTFSGKRYDRLFLANSHSKKLELLAESSLISHYCWLDNTSLAVYQNNKGNIESYFHLNIEKKEWTKIMGLEKYGDGHPSGNNMRMVTDSYPDRSGMQSLFLYKNLENQDSIRLLGRFYHPLNFRRECRCDLHPRYDEKRKLIYFDSVFSGKRQLYRMDLS